MKKSRTLKNASRPRSKFWEGNKKSTAGVPVVDGFLRDLFRGGAERVLDAGVVEQLLRTFKNFGVVLKLSVGDNRMIGVVNIADEHVGNHAFFCEHRNPVIRTKDADERGFVVNLPSFARFLVFRGNRHEVLMTTYKPNLPRRV